MTKHHQLGICIVGCGDMGTKHAERWDRLPEARVVAVVDIVEERAATLAHSYGLQKWYTDYHPAVARADVDVVSVCVPTCSHPAITIYAADRGKHVLCEKPIALTLPAAQAMVEAAKRSNVKLGLGFMRRHSPVLASLRELLAAGRLGRPVLYHATDFRGIRPKREMHDANANGGPIIDMGVHLFDLWSYIFDSGPEVVFGQGLKLARNRNELAHIPDIAYDTATVSVRYASGDIGAFVVSWGLPPTVIPTAVPDHILGPKGAAQAVYGMTHQQVDRMAEGGNWDTVTLSQEDMYQVEIARFAQWVVEDRSFPATGAEGVLALRIALAALEAIQTGQPVSLVSKCAASERAHV